MLLALMFSIAASQAQESVSVEPGAFVVASSDVVATVATIGRPQRILARESRVCRVGMWLRDGSWSAKLEEGCPEELVSATEEAAQRWELSLDRASSRNRRLFEVWYRYPRLESDPLRIAIRQSWNATLTVPPDIEVLPMKLTAFEAPQYPAEALELDTRVTQCEVDLNIGSSGVPAAIEVYRCDDVFREPVRAAMVRWRFAAPTFKGLPTSSAATLGVLFTRSLDGLGGTAKVQLPPPLAAGEEERSAPVTTGPPERGAPITPMLFAVDHKSFAEVQFFELAMPEPWEGRGERTCDVLIQVNSRRQVWFWPEPGGCPEELHDRVRDVAAAWLIQPGKREENELYARVRGSFVFGAKGGPVRFRVPEGDVVTDEPLPPDVTTYEPARPSYQVPPKIPEGVPADADPVCDVNVTITAGGKVSEVTSASCDDHYLPAARDVVKRWRWSSAREDGKRITSTVGVRVRFPRRS